MPGKIKRRASKSCAGRFQNLRFGQGEFDPRPSICFRLFCFRRKVFQRFVIALVLGQGAQEGQKSEDLLHLDLDGDWSEEIAAETRERMKELGLGADALHVTDLEFPPG